jgi:hypothetical protein
MAAFVCANLLAAKAETGSDRTAEKVGVENIPSQSHASMGVAGRP